MSRRPARCTQADMHRAIKAAEQAGGRMGVKVCPDGAILLLPVEMLSPVLPSPQETPVFDTTRRIPL